MLFDEGIDFDQSQNLSSAAERFYEDIFNPSSMTNEEQWKKISSSVGLPTPPSTPEKCPQRLRNNMKLVDSSVLNMHYYSSPIHQSPNNNLQVVPDTITGDDVQDIIPFLTDLGNRSIASPNFFETNVSQGTCNSQAKQSPPPCTPSDSIVRSPSFQAEQTFTHTGSIFSDCSSEGSYPVSTYRDIHVENTANSIQSCIPSMRETTVPECMLSPISPSKPLKRPYSAISVMPRGQNIIASSAVRKLDFMNDVAPDSTSMGHNNGTQSMAQVTHGSMVPNVNVHSLASLQQSEQYLRQISIESVEKFRKVEEAEKSGETELSRATHNVLERQRRNDLKMRFHTLRDNLPDLMNNEKAPKIQILKKAYEFTQELKAQEQRLLADKELERQRKFILLRRLHALRQGFFDY